MARLNWTDQAILDLVNIVDFITKDSVRYAKITVTRIRVASNQLKKHPLIGRAVPETATKISNQNTFTFSPYILLQFFNELIKCVGYLRYWLNFIL